MTITRPCYCSRDDVMAAFDVQDSLLANDRADRAIESAAEDVDGAMKRYFYPWDDVKYFNWPNFQYTEPWIYRTSDQGHDLIALTQLQSPGASAGQAAVSIPLYQIFLEPVTRQYGWPFTRIELDRSTAAAWGVGPTPQHSIWAVGTWGFTADADIAAALAEDVTDAATEITLTNGATLGAGNLAIIGYGRGNAPYPTYPGTAGAIAPYLGERVIVQDKNGVDVGLVQSGSGCSSASSSDNLLTTNGGTLNRGELVQLDGEQMFVETVLGPVATVRRAWNGTVLAEHTAAVVYPFRQLTVIRGALGTVAAAATAATSVSKHRVPSLIRDLSIGVAEDQMLQEPAGYSRTVAAEAAAMPGSGISLPAKWNRAKRRYAHQQRNGTI